MKSWTLRFNVQDRNNFDLIREGKKTVETRAATPKYRKVTKGDTLIFVCGRERLERKVRRSAIYRTIRGMVQKIPRKHIMPNTKTFAEMERAYLSYPGYREKLKTFGVIAFYI